jgi:hypothetical protein
MSDRESSCITARMRCRAWFRVLIGVWGLWFTSSLSTPLGLHSCPAHGGHAPTHANEGAHSSHAASHSDSGNQSHHKSDRCTCLGWCCCVASFAAPARPTNLPTATIERAIGRQYPAAARPIVRWAHALPFANGPPAT